MSLLSRSVATALAISLFGILSAGCQTTSGKKSSVVPPKDGIMPAPPPPSWEFPDKTNVYAPAAWDGVKLAPSMEVAWNITTGAKNDVPHMSGKSQVGPDGTLVVGPYGSIQVAGMTVGQASLAIEKRVQPHLPNPHVQLQLVSGNQPAGKTWSSTNGGNGTVPVTSSAPDWTTNQVIVPPANYQNAAWSQPVPAVNAPATTTTVTPPNKRGPILTSIFGPRY